MFSSKKKRDQQGRFITEGGELGSELLGESKVRVWKSFKAFIFFMLMLILTLPWSVIFFEPAKLYGYNAVE